MIRKEFFKFFDGVGLMNGGEHVLKPGKYLDLILFAGLDKRKEDASGLSADIVAMEEPVVASNDKGFNGSFAAIVVDFQASIIEVDIERFPMSEGIKECCT